MVIVTTDQIKLEPTAFIEQVEAGNEIVIVRDSRSIARVVPTPPLGRPVFGSSAGKITMSEDFDGPVADFAEYLP